jgi:hypothetical protein
MGKYCRSDSRMLHSEEEVSSVLGWRNCLNIEKYKTKFISLHNNNSCLLINVGNFSGHFY